MSKIVSSKSKHSGKSKGQLLEELKCYRRRVRELERIVTERDLLEASHQKDAIRLMKAIQRARITVWSWTTDERRLTLYLPSLGGIRDSQGRRVGEIQYTEEQLLRNIHPDDRERVARVWDQANKEHVAYVIYYQIVYADDEVRDQLEIGSPERDDSGRYVGFFGTTQDITERKRAEEALKESERTLAAAQRIAGLGHWLWDEGENRIITFSEQLARIFGVEPEEFPRTSEGWFAFIHPDDRERAVAEIKRCVTNQSGFDLEYRIVRSDGQIRYVRDLSEPLFDDDGRFVHTLGTLLDFTDRKLAEEELHESEARLDQLQLELTRAARLGAMGEMASALAHELNQPLTAIMNYLQAGQRALDGAGTSSSVRIDDVMAKAIAQADRASAIIRGLRRFIDMGEVERVECNINDLVKEAAILGIVGAPDDVDLTLELSDSLPAVSVDRIQVQQVVLNLVRNGVDAMAETTERKITVRTGRDRDGGAEITVRDSGTGVPSHVAERLFEPFVTTKTDGMGIGLSISRSIVEDHGGELWVTPNREGGSTFHFTVAGGSQSNDE